MTDEHLNSLLWGVRRSIRYHTRRRAFFDRMSMWGSALAVLMGSVAFTTTLRGLDETFIVGLALLTTVVSVANLVVGSAHKARVHHDLVRKFSKLEIDVACKTTPTNEDVSRIECGRLEVEAEEPPKLHVLDAICHNELIIAEGRSLDHLSDIGFLQWVFSDVGDWRPHTLRTRAQKATERAAKLQAKRGAAPHASAP